VGVRDGFATEAQGDHRDEMAGSFAEVLDFELRSLARKKGRGLRMTNKSLATDDDPKSYG